MKPRNTFLILASLWVCACSNRYVIYPDSQMHLLSGEKVTVYTVSDSVYQDRIVKEFKDSIACAKRKFLKDDLSKVEKKEISIPKTFGLVTSVGAGIVVLPFVIILIGVASGAIPFDN